MRDRPSPVGRLSPFSTLRCPDVGRPSCSSCVFPRAAAKFKPRSSEKTRTIAFLKLSFVPIIFWSRWRRRRFRETPLVLHLRRGAVVAKSTLKNELQREL